jgi:hypothetical protein
MPRKGKGKGRRKQTPKRARDQAKFLDQRRKAGVPGNRDVR